MALQDLTPQLRTRLNRAERAVGWFVFLAVALLLFGFGYYIYQTAQQRGWFVIKAKFHTYLQSSAGLAVGDTVVMMGFPVGNITQIKAEPPGDPHNVEVEFEIRDNYFRYLWQRGSVVVVNSSGFIGSRELEVTRGTNGYELCVTQPVFDKTIPEIEKLAAAETNHWQLAQDVFDAHSNIVYNAFTMLDATNVPLMAGLYSVVGGTNLAKVSDLPPPDNTLCVYNNTINRNRIVASWHERRHKYLNFTPARDSAWLESVEPVGVGDRLAQVVAQVQSALPGFFALTNQLARVLDNTASLTSNLDATVVDVRPAMTNVVQLTALLHQPGGVGTMALGTNGPAQLAAALDKVNLLLASSDTNMDALVQGLLPTLLHVADLTSNLNAQVQASPTMLPALAKTISDTDDMVQGLKRHWLLRSAFKKKAGDTNSAAH
jgi:hypothetical protein